MTRVFVIAGEASGDALGAAVLAGLRGERPDLQIDGVGGPLMQAEGLVSRFPMDELSVMGIAEVLPRYRHLVRRMHQMVEAVAESRPDVLLTIDSPDFCLRVAKRAKAARPDLRTVHYVAPTVWAWRPKRAAKMSAFVDHVLALFPFEPPYMQTEGMDCDFVGHPVATAPQATDAERAAFRAVHGIDAAPMLLVLPGSRGGEVSRLLPIFGAVLRDVLSAYPEVTPVIPMAHGVRERVRQMVTDWPVAPLLLDPTAPGAPAEKRAAFGAADLALAASGTVSLELAAADTPMVIAYDMNWISRKIIQAMVKIDTATLVNLVSETRVVPEFLGARCDPALIAPAVIDLLKTGGGDQRAAMAETMQRLGRGGPPPGERAARAILEGLPGGSQRLGTN